MKKSLLTKSVMAAGIFGLSIAASTANASFGDCKFYAGAGLDYSKHSLDKSEAYDSNVKIKNKGLGLLIPIVGLKFHDNFAVEAGYSFNKKISFKQVGDPNVSYKVSNAYLDVVGLMPTVDKLDLLGGLGVGRLMVRKGENTPSNWKVKNKFGWRVKLGAQYNFTSNVAVRALATYQSVKNKVQEENGSTEKFVKNMKSIGLSAIYSF